MKGCRTMSLVKEIAVTLSFSKPIFNCLLLCRPDKPASPVGRLSLTTHTKLYWSAYSPIYSNIPEE